jgi:hypothetical protein
MGSYDLSTCVLVAMGGGVMAFMILRTVGQVALATAYEQVAIRRAEEAQRKADNAAAEAAGRAAALEPLALNPDGTIEEPILAAVEEK